MFEDSLVESKTAPISTTKQWTTIGSIVVQSVIVTLLIALPLFHPEQLPLRFEPPRLLAPIPPRPVIHIQPAAASSGTSAGTLPSAPHNSLTLTHFHNPVGIADPEPQPTITIGDDMRSGTGMPDSLTATSHTAAVSIISTRPAKPLSISGGVSAGMLLAPIRPVYPAIAKATHVEGTIIVEAVISRTGSIESMRVVSGPDLLRQAALEAIQAARYRPYRLNGEAVDVHTTITVNFRMSS